MEEGTGYLLQVGKVKEVNKMAKELRLTGVNGQVVTVAVDEETEMVLEADRLERLDSRFNYESPDNQK